MELTTSQKSQSQSIRTTQSSADHSIDIDDLECGEAEGEDWIGQNILVELWAKNLKLVSVLAIFFASTEATLLGFITPGQGQLAAMSKLKETANICLTIGLILHVVATFVSFLGEYFLVQYKWDQSAFIQKTSIVELKRSRSRRRDQMVRIPRGIPGRFHFMCVILTALGFASSLVGLICDAYDRLPPVVGSISAVVILTCLCTTLAILFTPDELETKENYSSRSGQATS